MATRDQSPKISAAHQEKAVEALRDWSKWLIGINFAAVTGCAVVLETGGVTGIGAVFLVLAIASFAASVFSSIALVRGTARVLEILPLHDDSGNLTTVFSYRLVADLSLGMIARVQLALLGVGAIFFLLWVIINAATGIF